MNRSKVFLNIFALAFFLVFSCSSSDVDTAIRPTNLTVIITVVGASDSAPAGNGSGEVRVSAYAENAVRYSYRFDEGEVIETSSRTVNHLFEQEGTHSYPIEVKAFSATGETVSETLTVTVYKSGLPEAPSLVFADEFDYEGNPDPEKWYHQVVGPNNGSWYNGEAQHYTARPVNSYVSDGTLKIRAQREEYTSSGITKSFTSARLNSKYAFTYGRVEVRAKLPVAGGTWPAIWTLGANINESGNFFGSQYGSVGWPACGEIDIMEQRGWDKSTTLGYFHWGDTQTGAYRSEGSTRPVPGSTDEFHLYILEWDDQRMRIYVDEVLVHELSNTTDKPYDNPHYLLLNVAMGGNLGGEIPGSFTEGIMEVDYVRVYRN